MKLLIAIAALLFVSFASAYEIKFPTLDTNEMKFKDLKSYTKDDFSIRHSVKYLEIISFETKPYTGTGFNLNTPFTYDTLLSIGKAPNIDIDRAREILAQKLIKRNYFWKWQEYPTTKYRFNVINIFKKGSNTMLALENIEELRSTLKRVNTEAEVLVWSLATSQPFFKPYSYIKKDGLYRVRFLNISKDGCHIKEIFKYYNRNGDIVKNQLVRDEDIANCSK